MAKKKTKLDKMSKKEKTSLAYALATNLAKYGRPQSPKNERKLTKGEINNKEKHMGKFKKAFDLEEIQEIVKIMQEKNLKSLMAQGEKMAAFADKQSGYEGGLATPVRNVLAAASVAGAPDFNGDRDLKAYWARQLAKAIETQKSKKYMSGFSVDEMQMVNKETGKDVTKHMLDYMEKKITKKEFEELTGLRKNEALDPVGQEDADINNDGKVDKTDNYLKNRRKAVSKSIKTEDLDLGHQDNEPHMLKKDLYRIAKYASELYMMVNDFDNKGMEVDFPHWWQSKIIKAKSMLVSAKHYLDGELTIPQIDAMLEEEMDINDPVLVNFRAARDRTNKILSQPKADFGKEYGDAVVKARSGNNNDTKLRFLNKERDQLMRDMEQEAEPEGGPIADRYGAELNRIDNAISKLSGRKEMTYDQAIAEAKVDYDFSERELIRVLRQLKRGASTEIDMIKAFTKALGRDITKDELFKEAISK